jgi:hypothetical protein
VWAMCEAILDQARRYIAGSGAQWYRGFHISSSTLCGRSASPYSRCFTMRAIPLRGPVDRIVPANRSIDAGRFAAGHRGR